MYAASLNVFNIFWHMGTGYRYAAWQATQNRTTAPGPRPLYYEKFFSGHCLWKYRCSGCAYCEDNAAGGLRHLRKKQWKHLVSKRYFSQPDSFNSTETPSTVRSSEEFTLASQLRDGSVKVTARPLTAAGAEVRDGISFAGQTIALNGTVTGSLKKHIVKTVTVQVYRSEVVLQSVEYESLVVT
ncbi:glycoside hydrolase family 79 protein [Periconia macrospinosa]|uniref:Glycoside hydrolase family 79 protein n=1 Tax=Periconia macrospinosa TaxID=97972 RepID=A0A2V1E6P4_9PLEO|nr:glycoside hydrolase family 79 protein [Periconia macrospinosa]